MTDTTDRTRESEKYLRKDSPESLGDEMSWKDLEGGVGTVAMLGLILLILALVFDLYDYLVSAWNAIVAFVEVLANTLARIGLLLGLFVLFVIVRRGTRKK